MEEYIIIQLKDICCYDDDFEYKPFIVKKDNDFEEKYNELIKVCKNYNDFQEVEDFIYDNFKIINFEKRIIEV